MTGDAGIPTSLLLRDFLVAEGLCDTRRALDLASRFDRQISEFESLNTENGSTFIRTSRRTRSALRVHDLRQLRLPSGPPLRPRASHGYATTPGRS